MVRSKKRTSDGDSSNSKRHRSDLDSNNLQQTFGQRIEYLLAQLPTGGLETLNDLEPLVGADSISAWSYLKTGKACEKLRAIAKNTVNASGLWVLFEILVHIANLPVQVLSQGGLGRGGVPLIRWLFSKLDSDFGKQAEEILVKFADKLPMRVIDACQNIPLKEFPEGRGVHILAVLELSRLNLEPDQVLQKLKDLTFVDQERRWEVEVHRARAVRQLVNICAVPTDMFAFAASQHWQATNSDLIKDQERKTEIQVEWQRVCATVCEVAGRLRKGWSDVAQGLDQSDDNRVLRTLLTHTQSESPVLLPLARLMFPADATNCVLVGNALQELLKQNHVVVCREIFALAAEHLAEHDGALLEKIAQEGFRVCVESFGHQALDDDAVIRVCDAMDELVHRGLASLEGAATHSLEELFQESTNPAVRTSIGSLLSVMLTDKALLGSQATDALAVDAADLEEDLIEDEAWDELNKMNGSIASLDLSWLKSEAIRNITSFLHSTVENACTPNPSVMALVGPSGIGKSTLINALLKMTACDAGTYRHFCSRKYGISQTCPTSESTKILALDDLPRGIGKKISFIPDNFIETVGHRLQKEEAIADQDLKKAWRDPRLVRKIPTYVITCDGGQTAVTTSFNTYCKHDWLWQLSLEFFSIAELEEEWNDYSSLGPDQRKSSKLRLTEVFGRDPEAGGPCPQKQDEELKDFLGQALVFAGRGLDPTLDRMFIKENHRKFTFEANRVRFILKTARLYAPCTILQCVTLIDSPGPDTDPLNRVCINEAIDQADIVVFMSRRTLSANLDLTNLIEDGNRGGRFYDRLLKQHARIAFLHIPNSDVTVPPITMLDQEVNDATHQQSLSSQEKEVQNLTREVRDHFARLIQNHFKSRASNDITAEQCQQATKTAFVLRLCIGELLSIFLDSSSRTELVTLLHNQGAPQPVDLVQRTLKVIGEPVFEIPFALKQHAITATIQLLIPICDQTLGALSGHSPSDVNVTHLPEAMRQQLREILQNWVSKKTGLGMNVKDSLKSGLDSMNRACKQTIDNHLTQFYDRFCGDLRKSFTSDLVRRWTRQVRTRSALVSPKELRAVASQALADTFDHMPGFHDLLAKFVEDLLLELTNQVEAQHIELVSSVLWDNAQARRTTRAKSHDNDHWQVVLNAAVRGEWKSTDQRRVIQTQVECLFNKHKPSMENVEVLLKICERECPRIVSRLDSGAFQRQGKSSWNEQNEAVISQLSTKCFDDVTTSLQSRFKFFLDTAWTKVFAQLAKSRSKKGVSVAHNFAHLFLKATALKFQANEDSVESIEIEDKRGAMKSIEDYKSKLSAQLNDNSNKTEQMGQVLTRLIHLARISAPVQHSEHLKVKLPSSSNGQRNFVPFRLEPSTTSQPCVVSGPATPMDSINEEGFLKVLREKHGFKYIHKFDEMAVGWPADDGDDSTCVHSLAMALSHQLCGVCDEESVRCLRYELCMLVRAEMLSNTKYNSAINGWASKWSAVNNTNEGTPVTNYLTRMVYPDPLDEAMVDAFCRLRRVFVVVWTQSGQVVFGDGNPGRTEQFVYNVARVDRLEGDEGDEFGASSEPITLFHSLSAIHDRKRCAGAPNPQPAPSQSITMHPRLLVLFDNPVLLGFRNKISKHMSSANAPRLTEWVKNSVWPSTKLEELGTSGILLCFPAALKNELRTETTDLQNRAAVLVERALDDFISGRFAELQSPDDERKVKYRCFDLNKTPIVEWAMLLKRKHGSRVVIVRSEPLATNNDEIVCVSIEDWKSLCVKIQESNVEGALVEAVWEYCSTGSSFSED
eukprot:c19399_g1_i1.p1 GENE.c19399_g1_i1~~c19399_g1_i1.p1  ORF type:complete len:1790 (+),score=379.91 c19399_g1_i1:48-5417(+)